MVLLIAALLITSQVAMFIFVQSYLKDTHAQDLARRWAQVLILAAHLPPTEHAAAKDLLGITVEQPTSPVAGSPIPQPNHFLALVSQHLHSILGPTARIVVDPAHHSIHLLWNGPQPVEVQLPMREGMLKPLPWFQAVAILSLSLIGGLLAARQITKPLMRLIDRLEHLRRGEQEPPKAFRGPRDIRQLSERVGRLIEEIESLIREREMVLVGVSHDLRTPLTRMRMAAEFLSDVDAEGRADLIENIHEMNSIVEQFIAYARDGQEEIFQRVDLNILIQNIIKRTQKTQQIDISFLAGNVPPVAVQPISFSRALVNVLENANRHAAGPAEMATCVEGDQVILSIRDHGPGIPSSLLPEITQPFAMAGKGGGIGLGLAIVERIIQRHGGSLALHNHVSGGLIVEIAIPVLKGQV